MNPNKPGLRAVTQAVYLSDMTCMFCKKVVYAACREYHVDGIGPMCVNCLTLSHITFKGADSYVSVMPTTPNSYAVRIG